MAWTGQRAIGCHGRLVMQARHGGHRRSTGRASDGPTKENDKPGDTAMTERRHLEQRRHGRGLSRGCNGRGNRSSPARPLLRAYIVRQGEVVCCAEGRVGVFNGGVDWDDKSEPINLPLGYTRGTYKAELARRARIYANWGKTT